MTVTTSTQTSTATAKPAPTPRNGIDTPAVFATIQAVAQQPELAKFRFRATSRWIEGVIDLRGVLGISDEVRNGYESIRVSFRIKGDASAEKLREVVEQSRKRSAVFDIVTRPVPVEVVVES